MANVPDDVAVVDLCEVHLGPLKLGVLEECGEKVWLLGRVL
jgi:hypothetical protein